VHGMATTVEAAPVRLRLVVCPPDGGPRDVELDAYADSTVDDVVEAILEGLDLGGREHSAYLRRSGRWLSGDVELGRAGICQGDELVLSDDRRVVDDVAAPGAVVDIAVVGGPASGRRFPLSAGDHFLGRDPGCAIAIDDPSLSGRHLRLQVAQGGAVRVADDGSRNGSSLEGVALPAGELRPLERDQVIQAGRTLLTVDLPRGSAPVREPEADGSVPFNRPPRVRRPIEPAVRPFPAPPDDPHRARIPLIASLVPLALGVGLYLLTTNPAMLFFAAFSPVMAISTFLEDRRSGKKGFAQREREYRERLAALKDELEAERAREVRVRRAAAPPAPELLARARTHAPTLWERREGDPDFLTLRLGTAEQPANLSVRLDPGGNEELRAEGERLSAWYATVPAVPVVVPLVEVGAVGLCGPDDRVAALGRWLAAQAAALHSPRELVIAAALSPERLAGWEWLKWLPHAHSETTPLGLELATGDAGARELLEEAARLIRDRRAEGEGAYAPRMRTAGPAVLLVLDELVAPERPLVTEVLSQAADHGIAAIWLGRERRDLPGECGAIVELDAASHTLACTDTRSGQAWRDVTAEGLEIGLALDLARALAPARDTSALRAGAGVPERVPLVDLLETAEPSSDWVAGRWGSEPAAEGAILGAAANGPFRVELRVDGPHALIAGTTGAGKSELLQTLIASLAVGHPPASLTFLLIDYKGGAAFKECVALPHTVGFVTDLDSHLTQRALVSLNAELRRRERILRDAGAKDLADMERRDRERAPASLVIVIDEFATLAREVPDFVDGVVDVAQRGRSLGVHLVLATQRPGGVVSENIRANTNLRVALRVNESAESNDVIGSPEAARIGRDRPGRAFARTGHGELTEFQTAYVGGASVERRQEREIVVRELAFASHRERGLSGDRHTRETDLQQLVRAAADASERLALPPQPSPWLPPLEPVVPLDSLPEPGQAVDDPSAVAPVGLLDEPALQRQRPFALDLEAEGSVLVYGASGSGKTTFLRTLALSLASRAGPEALHVYGLDFATRGLSGLEALPHCGSVIAGEDEERTARLFALLRKAMEKRKLLFAQRGAFTLSEYQRTAGPEDEPVPRVVVLLDNYTGFAAAFERVNLGELVDALPRLVGDGRPLGVHFAIAADRRGAVPNALAGIIPAKLVLRMADEDEFAAFGIPLKTIRGAQLPPGRGFLAGGLEVQVALVGDDPSGEGQAGAVRELGERLRARYSGPVAPPIEPLPTRLPREQLPAPERALVAVLGVGDAEQEPVAIDLGERHFLVVGPYRSGRSTALRTVAESLHHGSPGVELHLLAPRRSPLLELPLWASVARGAEECDAGAARLQQAVEGRRGDGEPFVLMIDDAEELAESLGAAALESIVRRGRDVGVSVVAAVERQAAQRAFAGWIRELRKEEYGLLLDPDTDVDGDILGARLPRRTNPVYPPGRGYLVERGLVELVQVATG
jgi:S-DNA-T family DNA segregation ATPase FtsK/SpoIIIE